MRKILSASVFATILLTSFTLQLITTSLKITIRNGLGNIEPGVKVTLYATLEDYNKSVNPVETQVTDEKGNVWFKNLKQLEYWVSAEKGSMNNFDAGEKIENLAVERINKATIVITE
ncbi:MAG: hypothetical protein U0U66_11555 [Cytophagaceae bacterium]